jgi:hypothetical protein
MVYNNRVNAALSSGQVDLTNKVVATATLANDNDLIQARIQLKICQNYHKEPVIAHLISEHPITVNITAAPPVETPREDRWFSLELWGKAKHIRDALAYLDRTNALNSPGWLSSVSCCHL